jgi:ATP-dependent helicase HrpB
VFDERSGAVRAVERDCLGEIVLAERTVPPEPRVAAKILAERVLAHGLDEETQALVRRARFAGLAIDERGWVERACAGATSLGQVDVRAEMLRDLRGRDLERLAPDALRVPSGRSVRLEYRDDGGVCASVKLQELFGLAETPRVGPCGEPVTFQLLAPNGRPVQTTRDLKSFWERTYPAVRRELRGRYAKHPWPEDPWTARATAKTKRR